MNTYELNGLGCNFAGIQLDADRGWGEGGALVIEQQTPDWGYKVGVGGLVTRYRNNDLVTKLTFTFQQETLADRLLSGIVNLDRKLGNGASVGPLTIAYTLGTFFLADLNCWIEGLPLSRTYSNESSDVEWVIWAPRPERLGG